ncbi:hypothetical protein IMSAGC013_04883 [Lachnospiraceae bacterium]|nr:hypothetical protein IMSAGC013_04883 [Lachnospiraceae bacterium]
MMSLFDKLILFICCTLLLFTQMPAAGLFHILAILSAITFTCFCGCCNADCLFWQDLARQKQLLLTGLWLPFAGLSLLFAEFGCFLPLLFYEMAIVFPISSLYRPGLTPAKTEASALPQNPLNNPMKRTAAFLPAAFLLPFYSLKDLSPFCPWIVLFFLSAVMGSGF